MPRPHRRQLRPRQGSVGQRDNLGEGRAAPGRLDPAAHHREHQVDGGKASGEEPRVAGNLGLDHLQPVSPEGPGPVCHRGGVFRPRREPGRVVHHLHHGVELGGGEHQPALRLRPLGRGRWRQQAARVTLVERKHDRDGLREDLLADLKRRHLPSRIHGRVLRFTMGVVAGIQIAELDIHAEFRTGGLHNTGTGARGSVQYIGHVTPCDSVMSTSGARHIHSPEAIPAPPTEGRGLTPSSPHPIFALSSDLVERIADQRPSSATFWGLPGRNHRWEDLSPEGVAAWRGLVAEAQSQLDALPPGQGEWDTLAVDVLRTWLQHEREADASGEPFRWLGHIASPFQNFHLTLSHMERGTEEARDAVRARLAALPEALTHYRAALAHGLTVGERASVRQVRSCVDQGHNIVANRLLDLVEGSEADLAHQAYADLTEWLATEYLPAADPADGIGEARYQPAAERFLHDELNLDETYAWGWELVHDLHTQLQDVLTRIAPGSTLAEAVQRWRTDPTTTAPDAETFLDRVRGWQAGAQALLSDLVPIPPIVRKLRIERAPQGLPPGAWYISPSEDGLRPGTIQYSLQDGPVPVFDQQSTACHEGFPGHHLQLALQTSIRDRLSRLHRLVFHCLGFAEGWALYAERLVDEHAGYESDVQRAGYLVNQIARACRVVLDIGLHTHRPIPHDVPFPDSTTTGVERGATWTYDRAVRFMTEIGGLRPEVSASEITRYLGWPGQAISYSVGMKRMLEVRTSFLARGGHLRDFHEQVLGSGMVGLRQLADRVRPTRP